MAQPKMLQKRIRMGGNTKKFKCTRSTFIELQLAAFHNPDNDLGTDFIAYRFAIPKSSSIFHSKRKRYIPLP